MDVARRKEVINAQLRLHGTKAYSASHCLAGTEPTSCDHNKEREKKESQEKLDRVNCECTA
jgi:hypothetical protein